MTSVCKVNLATLKVVAFFTVGSSVFLLHCFDLNHHCSWFPVLLLLLPAVLRTKKYFELKPWKSKSKSFVLFVI